MRIISGKFKNKKIYFPKNLNTRPLRDIVRENIFNIIEHSKKIEVKIKNSNILDLYAGSGSFGIECISSLIVGFFLLLITISWLSYTLSTLTVGHTLMLCIFKKRSDNVNILGKKDEEEEFENNILESKNDLLIEADDQLNKNNQNDSEDLDNTEE